MWLFLLVAACVVAALSCGRLCRVVAAANLHVPVAEPAWDVVVRDEVGGAAGAAVPELATVAPAEDALPGPGPAPELGLVDTAYLAGGPERVVDLVLLRMALGGRLLLAHTGWTTVARPGASGPLERAALRAIGPEGQCRTEELRARLATDAAVREVAARLARAGLAVPEELHERLCEAGRRVGRALAFTVVCLGLSLVARGAGVLGGFAGPPGAGKITAWFSLPLILTTGTLLMARIDVYPYTRWAAPAGQELLRRLAGLRRGSSCGAESPAAVAVAGTAAVRDPLLRAALRPSRRSRRSAEGF